MAENLPEDHCYQNLMKIFSAVGRYLLTINSENDCSLYYCKRKKKNEGFDVYFIDCSVKTIRTCYPQTSNGTTPATNRSAKLDMLFANKVLVYCSLELVLSLCLICFIKKCLIFIYILKSYRLDNVLTQWCCRCIFCNIIFIRLLLDVCACVGTEIVGA